MILRDYQEAMKADVYGAWNAGHRNVLAVAPTGSGKTALKARIFAECKVPAWAIAHRQELVGQISEAIAECGVYHRIIAPSAVVKFCIAQHLKKFGRSFHHNQAPMTVAGVDTLNARSDSLTQSLHQAKIWDIDEAHHVLQNNKWGKAVGLFPNAWGLGVTASPRRCDRRSLGRNKSGVFDHMVIGPTMRDLINRGYLADYRIYGPPQSIDTSQIRVSEATGEFNQEELRAVAHKSTITGDIVDHYLRLAPGKRGITFAVDVEIAIETAKAFEAKGVPAVAVTAKTNDMLRTAYMERFRAGNILQLVNVDLFGEGLDVPAVECVSMGRPTQSFSLYLQQFGRALRPAPGKTHGIIIDHVGNVKRHKLPDRPQAWSLDDEERGRRKVNPEDLIPITTCLRCHQPFEGTFKACPFCGFVVEPVSRGSPEFVDGDLIEYSPELLAKLGAEIRRIDGEPYYPVGVPRSAINQAWAARQNAQRILRDTIALWAGIQRDVYDRSDSESYRRFYFMFGVDVATAQTLGAPEAEKLTTLIRETFT